MKTAAEYEVIVLGGGKAGKSLAIDLGNQGIKTALIERSPDMIGGTCINLACIPTKTLITSSRVARAARRAGDFGVDTGSVQVQWEKVRERAARVVSGMREMNHKNLKAPAHLDFMLGTARFVDPHSVEVRDAGGNLRFLRSKKIFINTGTRPAKPAIPGLESVAAFDSETIQRLPALPRHLLVIGGSYVGLEFAQMFRGFGSQVTVLERGSQILKREDEDIASVLHESLKNEGIDIRLNCSIKGIQQSGDDVAVNATVNGEPSRLVGSHLLLAVGRAPYTEDLNLSAASVEADQRGFVKVNHRLETSAPGIWALGDVNGGPQFTHASFDDYRIVKVNVFHGGNRTNTDRLIPFTLFTDPELSRVGITETEAVARGIEFRIASMAVSAIPRAKTISETRGIIKAVIDARSNRILGCAICSVDAGEMLGTVQMAMIAQLPYTALRDAVLSHPTMVEGLNNLFPAA